QLRLRRPGPQDPVRDRRPVAVPHRPERRGVRGLLAEGETLKPGDGPPYAGLVYSPRKKPESFGGSYDTSSSGVSSRLFPLTRASSATSRMPPVSSVRSTG